MSEFISSLPVSECVSRIMALNDRKGCLAMQSIRVKVVPDGDQIYWFSIRRWMYGRFVAEAKGDLVSQDNDTTIVNVEASTATYPQIFFLVAIPFGLLFLVGSIVGGNLGSILFSIVWLGVVVLNWNRLKRWRDELLLMVNQVSG